MSADSLTHLHGTSGPGWTEHSHEGGKVPHEHDPEYREFLPLDPADEGTVTVSRSCPAGECDGTGAVWPEPERCTCGTGPSGYYGMHEPGCGSEPCPAGCWKAGTPA